MTMLKQMPGDNTAVYFCGICGAAYSEQREAIVCGKDTAPLTYAKGGQLTIGDLVVGGPEYHWHDGAEHWVQFKQKTKSQLDNKGIRQFIWVVTAITPMCQVSNSFTKTPFNEYPAHSHDWVYHVRTLGLFNGFKEGMRGWNSRSHYQMARAVNVDPRVIEESRCFLGEIYLNLL